MYQPFIIIGRHYDYGRFAVLGDGLRLAPGRFDDLAKAVFCILD
jgi:hypothetical protein